MGHDLVDATDGELDVHDTLQLQAVLLEAVQERCRCRETEEKARKALQRINEKPLRQKRASNNELQRPERELKQKKHPSSVDSI